MAKHKWIELASIWIVLTLSLLLLYAGGCNTTQGIARDVAIGAKGVADGMTHYTEANPE